MKYFIGCLIKGEAKEYQEDLIERICGKFDVGNLNGHVPAHFTLKAPFETRDISEVENLIERFCEKEDSFDVEFGGTDSFRGRVVFLKGKILDDSRKTLERLIKEFRKIAWMEFRKHELGNIRLHSTLCRSKGEKQFFEIMDFLKNENVIFNLKFDNLAIFEKIGGKWRVYREFELR